MRVVRQLLLLLVVLVTSVAAVLAQPGVRTVAKTGTTVAPFLAIPVGARAIAMGGAFVGTVDDATSLYWNPSGLARLPHYEAMFTHTAWLADMNFNYAALAVPLGDFGSVGVSFTSLSMDDMEVRTVERPEGTGELFSAGSFAIGLHYARNLSDRFSIGFTAKFISEQIWDMRASAFALDVGTLFTANFLNGLRIGASITNFGTDMKLEGRNTRNFYRVNPNIFGSNDRIPYNIEMDSWDLPLNFQFGIATDIIQSNNHLLTIAIDALHPADNYESLNAGLEYGFLNTFFVRGGYHSLFLSDGEGGLSLGAGILADLFGKGVKARVDYAYWDFGRLKAVNVLAVSVLF